jgi:hypothetical protein
MGRTQPALLCAALLASSWAAAAPVPALEPLAFLAGHCWKGTMPDKATDEHCFAWVYDGKFLRDRHVVRGGDAVLYGGETIYYWNAIAKQVEYLYITNQGGHSHGRVARDGDTLTFPVATLVNDGKSYGIRSTWKKVGDNSYEVLREYQTETGWMPVKMTMKKVE